MAHSTQSSIWPSIDNQLAASEVIHGSALETLIRDNQDFHKLREEEAHDQLGLPPWLRVYWRKLHPDADYSGPGAGYPGSLSDLYEWMVDNQHLRTPPADVRDPADPRAPSAYGHSHKGPSKGGHYGK